MLRSYRKRESEKFPKEDVRVGATSEMIKNVSHLCMTISNHSTICDCSLVVFPYSFNGLGEKLCAFTEIRQSIPQDQSSFARFTIGKGCMENPEKLVAYHAYRRLDHCSICSNVGTGLTCRLLSSSKEYSKLIRLLRVLHMH